MVEMTRLVPASGPDQIIRGQIWGWNPGKDVLLQFPYQDASVSVESHRLMPLQLFNVKRSLLVKISYVFSYILNKIFWMYSISPQSSSSKDMIPERIKRLQTMILFLLANLKSWITAWGRDAASISPFPRQLSSLVALSVWQEGIPQSTSGIRLLCRQSSHKGMLCNGYYRDILTADLSRTYDEHSMSRW